MILEFHSSTGTDADTVSKRVSAAWQCGFLCGALLAAGALFALSALLVHFSK